MPFWSRKNDGWQEVVETYTVSIEELPPAIREKILRLQENDRINFCPYCGAKVRHADAKFCTNCGKALNED